MAILAVGSVAFDSIKSPFGQVERCLGGSATYFSLAARFFTDVRVIGVVGEDFTQENEDVLRSRGIDTSGIQREKGKSFFWAGEYGDNPNEAKLLELQLNVFQNFKPKISDKFKQSDYLFLGNIHPALQLEVRKQVTSAKLVCADTHPFWIETTRPELKQTLKQIDIMLMNDGETRQLAEMHNFPRAAKRVLAMGPKAIVVKHGEYGATSFFREGAFGLSSQPFRAPSMPIEEVVDPTGAGDCFAGGFMGYIASQGSVDREAIKRALFYGGVMGSFAVEKFGTARLETLTREEIEERFQIFRELTHLA
jgi:sugar/nucleoside kinase (ribokinase family)